MSTNNSLNLNSVTPLIVSYGGTGANNAASARTNLGAAASGANSDITSLTGLTGAVSTPSSLLVGNLELTGNTLSSTNSNGNMYLVPNGSGNVIAGGVGMPFNGPILQAFQQGTSSYIASTTYWSENAGGGLALAASASNTVGVLGAVSNARILGQIGIFGDDGVTGFVPAGGIQYNVSGTVSSGIVPSYMTIDTANTSGVRVVGFTMSNAQVATFANPIITTGIADSINQPVLKVSSGGVSSINYFNASNSLTLNAPTLQTLGADTNIPMSFLCKGIGQFYFSTGSSTPFIIQSGTAYQHITNISFANTSASRTVTFPDADGTVLLSDANSNVSANNFISGYATTVTAAGNTTLVVGSPYQQFFTGSTTQSVIMPVTSGLTVGQSWLIVNNSSGVVTVKSSGSNNIIAMAGGTDSIITCIAQAGTTAADWNAENTSGVAGVDSITGTSNQVIASSPSGAVTLSLPQSIATSSGVTFASTTFSSTAGIIGTTTNDSAAAGSVGELLSVIVLAAAEVALTTHVDTNIVTLSLTAGDWDVWGELLLDGDLTTIILRVLASITLTSNTIATVPSTSSTYCVVFGSVSAVGAAGSPAFPTGTCRISIASTTNVYLVANADFTISTAAAYGKIMARRVR